jgi:hypothetical protein
MLAAAWVGWKFLVRVELMEEEARGLERKPTLRGVRNEKKCLIAVA